MVEEMSEAHQEILRKQIERERKLKERGPASITPVPVTSRPKPPLIFIDPAMEIIQAKANPSYKSKIPLPESCLMCGGSLYPEIYRFNTGPHSPPILAFRCRECRFFFTVKVSLNPQQCNEDLALRDSQPNFKAPTTPPSYRPPPVA